MVQGSKRESKSVYGSDLYVIPNLSTLRKGDISAEISFVAHRIYIYGWQDSINLDLCWKYMFCFMHCWIFEYPTDGRFNGY